MNNGQQVLSAQQRLLQQAQARRKPLNSVVVSTETDKREPLPNTIGGGLPRSTPLNETLPQTSSVHSITSGGSGTSGIPKSGLSENTLAFSNTIQNFSLSSSSMQDDDNGQDKIRKQLERVGIAPTVEVATEEKNKPLTITQEPSLNISDMRSFLGQPPPQVGLIHCYIEREKNGKYKLFLENGDLFLLCSFKRKQNKTSNYLISLDKDDLGRDSGNYYGKVRANFVGTEFVVYDKGDKPTASNQNQVRQEYASILYEKNFLGTKGPRKMTVVLPAVDAASSKRSIVRATNNDTSELITTYRKGNTENLTVLRNKDPVWNEQLRAYVLDFNRRVTLPSVKNFQLVESNRPDKVIMQFGKVSETRFNCDFQYPMCGLQAFGIALSSFDNKLVCE